MFVGRIKLQNSSFHLAFTQNFIMSFALFFFSIFHYNNKTYNVDQGLVVIRIAFIMLNLAGVAYRIEFKKKLF